MKHAMVACALAFAASGCRSTADDLCADSAFDAMTCLSIEVTGQLEGASQLDTLQVDVMYPTTANVSGTTTNVDTVHRELIHPLVADGGSALPDGGGVGLPVEFPVTFPVQTETEEGIRVMVEALSSGQPVGLGNATADVQPTSHARMQVAIGPITPTRCFDGAQDGNEPAKDCGGDSCPACLRGSPCSGYYSNSSDCVDSVCLPDANNPDLYFCK